MKAAEIAERLTGRVADVCQHLFPAGRQNGDEFEVGDVTGTPGRSLRINLNGKAGVWSDFATGEKGDLLDLWRAARGLTMSKAIHEAAQWLGVDSARRPEAAGGVPKGAPAGHPKWKGTPSGRWCYTTADGKPWLIVYRYDKTDASKAYFVYDIQAGKWCKGAEHRLPDRRPLYRLGDFAQRPASEIVLVEGERCADALVRLGFEATTTLGGRGQIAKADFSPLVGWRVRIWRDNDDAGRQYATTAAAMLRAINADAFVVPVPADVPDGWDVADAVRDGWDIEEIKAQLDMAEPATAEPHDDSADTRTRFALVGDEYLEQLPPPDWLVTDVLLSETVAHLIGAPGSLKSFLAFDIAAHVQLGRSWHGRVVTAGPVVYVLAEGVRSFGLRIRAWKIHHEHQGPIGIQFLTMPVQLANTGEVGDLLDAIARRGTAPPRLTIFDTQARCSVGLEENSNTDMGRLIAGAERIQRVTGGTVALLHHTPRDAERERGATAQRGGVDTTLLVSADGDQITVKIDRQKDGDTGLTFAMRKRVIEVDASGRTSCVLVPVSDAERHQAPVGVGDLPASVRALLDALRGPLEGGATSAQLRLAAGLRDRTYFDALTRAKKWNLVDGTNRSYRITPIGRGLFV